VSGSVVAGLLGRSIFPEHPRADRSALTTVRRPASHAGPAPRGALGAPAPHPRAPTAAVFNREHPRLKLEYQLTRAIFVRYIGQYFAEDQAALLDPRTGQPLLVNGAAARAKVTNDFRNDVLFSYKPTPGTVVFLGYRARRFTEADAFRFRNLSRTADGFFLKLS